MSKLEKELAFYAAYHSNGVNKIIHVVTVPLLLVTSVTGLRNVANVGTLPFFAGTKIALNFPTAVVTSYSLYYFYLDFPSGFLWTALQGVPILMIANATSLRAIPNLTLSCFGLHAALWFVQVSVGHGIFEKRKPALVDGLAQAFLTSPLFVLLEVLLPLGYKKDLAKNVHHRAQLIRNELDQKKKEKALLE